jgi:hypothetical protein
MQHGATPLGCRFARLTPVWPSAKAGDTLGARCAGDADMYADAIQHVQANLEDFGRYCEHGMIGALFQRALFFPIIFACACETRSSMAGLCD